MVTSYLGFPRYFCLKLKQKRSDFDTRKKVKIGLFFNEFDKFDRQKSSKNDNATLFV